MLDTTPVVEPIHLDTVREALAVLGIDLDAKLRSVHFSKGYIEVVQLSVDSKGHVQAAGDEAATVTIRIPVMYTRKATVA